MNGCFYVGFNPTIGDQEVHRFVKSEFIELKNSPDGENPTHIF